MIKEFILTPQPELPPQKTSNLESMSTQEKKIIWRKTRGEVEQIVDARGCPIDAGIKDTVVALQVLDLPTSFSCEGHAGEGRPAPWVEVSTPDEPEERFLDEKAICQRVAQEYGVSLDDIRRCNHEEGHVKAVQEFSKNPETQEHQEWCLKNQKLLQKLNELLVRFYKQRKVTPAVQLIVEQDSNGSIVLHNGGQDWVLATERIRTDGPKIIDPNLPERLKQYQQEMRDFTNFLDRLYFCGEQTEQDILKQFSELRAQAHLEIEQQTAERVKNNPQLTEEEIMVGAFQEMLESPVRDAVFEFYRKGYSTTSSGFGGEDGEAQQIDGYFTLDEQAKEKLRLIGAEVVDGVDLSLSSKRGEYTGIRFKPAVPDLEIIKTQWDQIADILPPQEISVDPSISGAAQEFRQKYAPERTDIETRVLERVLALGELEPTIEQQLRARLAQLKKI